MAAQAIIVGTDGSASATEALREAARTAVAQRVPLHVVSAYRRSAPVRRRYAAGQVPAGLDVDYRGSDSALAHYVLEDAEDLALDLGARFSGHAVKGDPAEVLCRVARQVEAGLIVVGNKGVRGPLRSLRRPVCERVREVAPAPLHVVDTRAFWT